MCITLQSHYEFKTDALVCNPLQKLPRVKCIGIVINNLITSILSWASDFFSKEKELRTLAQTHSVTVNSHHKVSKLVKSYFLEKVQFLKNGRSLHLTPSIMKTYLKEWKKRKGKKNTPFVSLKDYIQSKPFSELKRHAVRYFDDEERRKTEIIFLDGKLYQEKLDSTTCLPKLMQGRYIFAMGYMAGKGQSPQPILCATPKEMTDKGKIQHSSFFCADNVASAGYLDVDQTGKITRIWNQSGHYQPDSQAMHTMLDVLDSVGCDLSTIKLSINHHKHPWMVGIANFFKRYFGILWGISEHNALQWYKKNGFNFFGS